MAELKQASEQHDGPIAAKTDNAHDSFADYRMGQIPEFKAPALGQGSKFVEWQMDWANATRSCIRCGWSEMAVPARTRATTPLCGSDCAQPYVAIRA